MSMLPPKIRDVVVELAKGLREIYGDRFRGLLLYGSYARGTAWEGSDVDLLLLLEGPVSPVREILNVQPIKNPLSLEADLALSIVPVSVEDFARGETTFLRAVRQDAIPVAA